MSNEILEGLNGKKDLSRTELEFMRFIWSHPDGVSSEEIYAHFPQTRGTKSTILYNISKKGYVEKRQEGRDHFYTALVSRMEYEQAVIRTCFGPLMEYATLEAMVASYFRKKQLTEKQKELVKDLLEELKKGKK